MTSVLMRRKRPLLTGGGADLYSQFVMADDPHTFLKLDETSGNWVDSSGNSRTVSAGAGVTRGKAGLVSGGGFSASGPGNTYIASYTGSLDYTAQTGLTMECWFRMPSSNIKGGLMKYAGTANGWAVSLGNGRTDQVGNRLVLGANGINWWDTGAVVSAGIHHVAVVRDQIANNFRVVLDGVQVWSSGVSFNGPSPTGFQVGQEEGIYLDPSVDIDMVAIYERALPNSKIALHYNYATSSLPGAPAALPVTSGLLLRYSADAITGVADNANMTTWTDLSGNGRHATARQGSNSAWPKYRKHGGPGDGPCVFYNNPSGSSGAGPWFDLPTNMFSGVTAGDVFLNGYAFNNTNGLWGMSTGAESHWPYGNGRIYEGWGSNTRYDWAMGVNPNSGWVRYEVYSAPNDWGARLNGTGYFSTTTNTVAFPSNPILGRGLSSGTPDFSFGGLMSNLVIFNRKLTAGERTDMEAWMQSTPSGGV